MDGRSGNKKKANRKVAKPKGDPVTVAIFANPDFYLKNESKGARQ
jgi:hypothetical protein